MCRPAWHMNGEWRHYSGGRQRVRCLLRLLLYRSSPSHPCRSLGRMCSSPWRVSPTHIFCLYPPHLSMHHPPRKRGFQFVARVAGVPSSFLVVRTQGYFSRPRYLSFSNLFSSCTGGLLLWLSAFLDLYQTFEATFPWQWH